jgi:hypothetical protein
VRGWEPTGGEKRAAFVRKYASSPGNGEGRKETDFSTAWSQTDLGKVGSKVPGCWEWVLAEEQDLPLWGFKNICS